MIGFDLRKKRNKPSPAENNFMKTSKRRLWNVVITMSVVVNLALLAGLGYIASLNDHVDRICSRMNLPILIYVQKNTDISGAGPVIKSPAKP
jgi:hypothetical protein